MDERAFLREEYRDLYYRVRDLPHPDAEQSIERVCSRLRPIPLLVRAVREVITAQILIFDTPYKRLSEWGLGAETQFVRGWLQEKENIFTNLDRTLGNLEDKVFRLADALTPLFPADKPAPFVADMSDERIRASLHAFYDVARWCQLLPRHLSMRVGEGLSIAGALEPHTTTGTVRDGHLTGQALIDAYLARTPFKGIKVPQVVVELPMNVRFAHTHIIGSTGRGKSTLLQNLILHDLKTEAGVIVIDPHHQLVPLLGSLKTKRRVIIVDPRAAPGINIFDVRDADDPAERKQVLNEATTMLQFLFAEVGTDTTGKQTMVAQQLCRLMLSRIKRHGPQTLMDLFRFLRDPVPFKDDIALLPQVMQDFFGEFIRRTPEYKRTAEELMYRLQPLLSDETLAPIFTSQHTTLNIRQEMDAGSLVLIDADESFLLGDTPLFGKVFLSLIMQAARKRGQDGRPVFLYIDEAHNFFDTQVNKILTDARKFRVGCTLAHQHLGQKITPELRGALEGAAIKFAGGVRAEDARAIAADMRTMPDFLMKLAKYHFAVSVDGSPAVDICPTEDPFKRSARVSDLEREARKVRGQPSPASRPSSSPASNDDDTFDWA